MAEPITPTHEDSEKDTLEGGKAPITFTPEQQAELDRRVTYALKKKEKETQSKMAEAQKLAKMSEEQKYQYELELKEKELQDKESQINIRENKIVALKAMAERNIPAELVDFIVQADADTTMANIKAFDKAFKKAVQEAVVASQKSTSPKVSTVPINRELTKDEFNKLGYSERVALMNSNPDLYKALTSK